MKKYNHTLMLALLAVVLIFTGCSNKAGTDSADKKDGVVDKSVVDTTYKTYYLNNDNIHIEGVSNIYTADTPQLLVTECLKSLNSQPENSNLKITIPEGVEVLSETYESSTKQVDIYFNSAYNTIPKNEEILVRAAIVKTLTQFEGVIDYVQFFVDGKALTENDGKSMIMMKSDFVETTRADIKHLNQELITLYFASTDGTQLVAEDIYVHYMKTTPLEKVIVESLISGPISKSLHSTMSSDVKINGDVNVVDGICYVDFNQRFLDRVNDQQSIMLNVYSVVNSLTQLENVNKVQIKIDGKIVDGIDDMVSLAAPLERNEELIAIPGNIPPVIENKNESMESMESVDETAGE